MDCSHPAKRGKDRLDRHRRWLNETALLGTCIEAFGFRPRWPFEKKRGTSRLAAQAETGPTSRSRPATQVRQEQDQLGQASIFRYSWATNDDRSRILFSNLAGPRCSHLTIRASYDEGRTWPVEQLVFAGSAAYSCIARLPDGNIGVVYERDGYGKLTFTSLATNELDADNSP